MARRLIDRAARTAAGLALLVGGVIAAQGAVAVASAAAPPAAGTAIGSIGVTALAEVLALFLLEAKLRADLGALAGQLLSAPRELAANVLGDVQAAGGWKEVRSRSMRLALPDAATGRRPAGRDGPGPLRPHRPPRDHRPAARLGGGGRAGLQAGPGRRRAALGPAAHHARTTAEWGAPVIPNGGRPPSGWHPSAGARRPATDRASSHRHPTGERPPGGRRASVLPGRLRGRPPPCTRPCWS